MQRKAVWSAPLLSSLISLGFGDFWLISFLPLVIEFSLSFTMLEIVSTVNIPDSGTARPLYGWKVDNWL